MKNSKLPWRKTPGNRPSHFQCADGYNIGSINSGGSTEGEANLNLIVKAVNEHAALVAVAEAASKLLAIHSKHSGQPPVEQNANRCIELNEALNNLSIARTGSEVAK